jgi:hypothetical protein
MIPIKTEHVWNGAWDCLACGLRAMGLFSAVSEQDFEKIETVSREMTFLVREGAIQPLDRQGRLYRIIKLNLVDDC